MAQRKGSRNPKKVFSGAKTLALILRRPQCHIQWIITSSLYWSPLKGLNLKTRSFGGTQSRREGIESYFEHLIGSKDTPKTLSNLTLPFPSCKTIHNLKKTMQAFRRPRNDPKKASVGPKMVPSVPLTLGTPLGPSQIYHYPSILAKTFITS